MDRWSTVFCLDSCYAHQDVFHPIACMFWWQSQTFYKFQAHRSSVSPSTLSLALSGFKKSYSFTSSLYNFFRNCPFARTQPVHGRAELVSEL